VLCTPAAHTLVHLHDVPPTGHRVHRLCGRACPTFSLGSFLLHRPNYLTDSRAPLVIYHLPPPAPLVLTLLMAAPLVQPARSLTSRSCSPLPGSRTPASLPRHLSTLTSRPCTMPQPCANVTLRALVRFAYTARPPRFCALCFAPELCAYTTFHPLGCRVCSSLAVYLVSHAWMGSTPLCTTPALIHARAAQLLCRSACL
jgi:hypothetical protein